MGRIKEETFLLSAMFRANLKWLQVESYESGSNRIFPRAKQTQFSPKHYQMRTYNSNDKTYGGTSYSNHHIRAPPKINC